jgi:hypothetical protein
MTYDEIRYAKAAINHACDGVTVKDTADCTALLVRNDAKLGIGYQLVSSIEELYELLPDTAGYPGRPVA